MRNVFKARRAGVRVCVCVCVSDSACSPCCPLAYQLLNPLPTHVPPPQDSAKYTNVGAVAPSSISTAAADVYVVDGHSLSAADAPPLRAFVEAGGGLVMGNHVWAYDGQQRDHPCNLVLSPMGILVSKDYVMAGASLDAATPPSQYMANAEAGFVCIEATLLGNTSHPCYLDTADKITEQMENTAAGLEVRAGMRLQGARDPAASGSCAHAGRKPCRAARPTDSWPWPDERLCRCSLLLPLQYSAAGSWGSSFWTHLKSVSGGGS